MRRQTRLALGGVLTGTVLLGAGTTLATFTDQAEVGATAGAASLTLQVTPSTSGGPLQVRAQDAGGAALQVTATGEVAGHLRLSLPGTACADLPDVVLTVTGLPAAAGTPAPTLCELTRGPVDLGLLAPAASGTPLTLRVSRGPTAAQSRAALGWMGDLTFELVQDPVRTGGLSDAQTVRVHLVVPGGGNGR